MKRTKGGIVVASIAVALIAVASPVAAYSGNADGHGQEAAERLVRTTWPLEVPASLDSALNALKEAGIQVDGVRFENDRVVGEFSLVSGQTTDEFLRSFQTTYGTEPQVVSAFVDEWREVSEDEGAQVLVGPAVPVDEPAFIAPPVSEEASERLRPVVEDNTPTNGATLLSTPPGTWVPQNVYPGTFRVGSNSQIFTNYVEWGSVTSPGNINSDYAMEIEINLHNDATGVRGSVLPWELCGPNFRDQFIAKNYNWNSWSVYSGLGSLASSYPYADLNDFLDSCGRNAMSIGFAFPQNIPDHVLGAELYTTIDAQVGVTSSSKLSGNVGLIERTLSCGPLTDPDTTNWTNCTGTYYPASPPVPSDRSTLNISRVGWMAAYDKCWTSGDYGLIAPVSFNCF